MPPRKMSEAIRYMPLSVLWVRSLIQPTANGLMKPARLPIELMKASPDAAAVPARNAVGRLQKSGNVVRMPILLKNSENEGRQKIGVWSCRADSATRCHRQFARAAAHRKVSLSAETRSAFFLKPACCLRNCDRGKKSSFSTISVGSRNST